MPKSPTTLLQRTSRATVAAGFVTGMLSGLSARPGSAPLIARLLADAGVPDSLLTDPSERIHVASYASLYNRLAEEIDDEAFGLFASPMRRGSFEFLCRSVITAATLAGALDRAARFLRLVLPDLAVTVERLKNGPALVAITLDAASPLSRCSPADPARVFAFEWLLRLLHALACWLVGRGLALDCVSFPYPRPKHAEDYALIYTEQSRFDAGSRTLTAALSANLLDLPVCRDEASLATFLEGTPGKIALLYRRDRETVLRVRDLLRAALPDLPPAAALARRLNLSERTLHRRLAEEGTNYRAIRDALRRDLALARLAKTQTPISRIASDLGYADPSAFYRAVVGWTGLPPTGYRQNAYR